MSARPKPRRVVRSTNSIPKTDDEPAPSSAIASIRQQGMTRSTASPGPSSAATAPTPALRRKPAVARQSSSSDSDIEFFTRRRPVAVVSARRPGTARAPVQTITISSSPGGGFSTAEESDHERATTKPLKLPDWTRARTGAEKRLAAQGVRKNRAKKKRRSEDSDANNTDDDDAREPDEAAVAEALRKLEAEEAAAGAAALMAGAAQDVLGQPQATAQAKGKGKAQVMVEEDSEEDSDDSFISSSRRSDGMGKRQSERARSKSLTPPAPMDRFQLESVLTNIRERVPRSSYRQTQPTLRSSPLPSQPDDQSHLDPSLQSILRAGAPGLSSNGVEIMQQEESHGDSEGEEQRVVINVSLVWDPDRPVASERAKAYYERAVPYEMGQKEVFRSLFQQVADAKDLDGNDLVLTYQKRRIFSFGTPVSLRIFASADFKCYPTTALYNKIQGGRQEMLDARLAARGVGDGDGAGNDDDDDEEDTMPEAPTRDASRIPGGREESLVSGGYGGDGGGGGGEGSGDLFKITIRGSATQSLSLAVKPSTTIGQLLKAYCRKFGFDEGTMRSMWCEWDGEKLDKALALSMYDEIEEEETIDVLGGK